MSRTFRRKNYELTKNTTWDRVGKKKVGYYQTTEKPIYNHHELKNGSYVCYLCGWATVYYECSKYKSRKEYILLHADSPKNIQRYNKKYGKFYYKRELRAQNKTELIKYMQNNEYEVMCLSKHPTDYLWIIY